MWVTKKLLRDLGSELAQYLADTSNCRGCGRSFATSVTRFPFVNCTSAEHVKYNAILGAWNALQPGGDGPREAKRLLRESLVAYVE
jgi:hypothetical protein